MDNSKLMKKVGYVVLGTYAAFNVLTLILMGKMFPTFGPDIAGPYSIMASKGFFIAYHVWGILVAFICMYAMWKELRGLFMISLMLMIILMFYPYFTQEDTSKAPAPKSLPAPMQP